MRPRSFIYATLLLFFTPMAWAMTHPDVTSVLVGARKVGHIDNALEAMDLKLERALRDEMSQWE